MGRSGWPVQVLGEHDVIELLPEQLLCGQLVGSGLVVQRADGSSNVLSHDQRARSVLAERRLLRWCGSNARYDHSQLRERELSAAVLSRRQDVSGGRHRM